MLLRLYGFCFKFRNLSLKGTLVLSEEAGFCSIALLSLSWCFSLVRLWGPFCRGTVAFVRLIAHPEGFWRRWSLLWLICNYPVKFLFSVSVMLCWLFLISLLWLCQLVPSDSVVTCPILQGGIKWKFVRSSWRICIVFIFSQVFLFKSFYCSHVA